MRINQQQGFTLVEMVAVIVILAILSFVALPRFLDRGSVDIRGFHDQALSSFRYAQKTAIARRSVIYVQVTANTIQICFDAACANPISNPVDSGQDLVITAPAGVTVAPPATPIFGFDALGRPVNTTFDVLTSSLVVGIAGKLITIEHQTGYVYS